MTLPRLEAIFDRWERVPPITVSVAGIADSLGVKFKSLGGWRRKRDAGGGDLQALMADLGASGMGARSSKEKPEWLTT